MEHQLVRKPRVLCLHGFRTSAKFFEKQTQVWPEFVREKMDLVFVDGPFPAEGVEGEYEWCAFEPNKDFSDSYRKFDGCIAFIEDCLTRMGPFDGLMGFSQGASVTAVLPGMQAEGVALTSVPKIKFVMLIGGFKFGGSIFPTPNLAKNAFSSPIQCPSLHVLSEKDRWKPDELLDSFVDPFVLHHPEGHVVPKLEVDLVVTDSRDKLVGNFIEFQMNKIGVFGGSHQAIERTPSDEKGLEIMLEFIEKIQELL